MLNKQLYDAVCYDDYISVKKILKDNKKYENFFEPVTRALGISLDINCYINKYQYGYLVKNPLTIACIRGCLEIIKELLCHKDIDPNISFSHICHMNTKIAKEFIIHPKFKNGNKLFLMCCENGYNDFVRMMIDIPTFNIYTNITIENFISKKLFKERMIKDFKFLPLSQDIIRHIIMNYF